MAAETTGTRTGVGWGSVDMPGQDHGRADFGATCLRRSNVEFPAANGGIEAASLPSLVDTSSQLE